ncbi:MAG: DUF814 domain-containing protein [Bacilli bacterium]|nr:DUF814 domain-containing protein [Bacilli bacterium]
MNNLKITSKDLQIIVNDLKEKIKFNHISNVTIINSYDIFFSFSMYRKEKLFISLNPQHPFVCLVSIDNPCGTKIGMLNDYMRKEIKDGFLLDVETLNNDRIVKIHYNRTNEYFDKEDRFIIIELIPHRPNFIVLNEENTILFATHQTDIANERPILKGLKYVLPENSNLELPEDNFNLDEFKEDASSYFVDAKRKRLQEQFKPVLTHIKSRIKTLKTKIKVLNKEIEEAKSHFIYQEIGTMILTYAYDENELINYVKENNIDYDNSLNPGLNANKYFQKYKKAKRTVKMDEKELAKTADEIAYYEDCLAQSKYMNEDDIQELAVLLFPNKFKLGNKKKVESKPGEVTVEGVKIYYGKNAKQNEQLTFKKANKSDLFLHIKDEHGSHVIVSSNNPSNEVILTACEIALLLSGKEDGEVQATEVKNIKKGSFEGQAILTSYKSYIIKLIRTKTKRLLNK